MPRYLPLYALLLFLSACSNIAYYGQAMQGHLSLMLNSEPVDELIAREQTRPALRTQLQLSQRILRFAEQEMQLPSHGSYETFVQVPGRYVVWNVIAAGEFSVEAQRWCYPFAGCVAYRGYYHEQEAHRFAAGLQAKGLDTTVVGASAYSTLGWLDDPLFSSMLYKDEARLVEVLIHELAHQRLYIADDTDFNEGFANVVAKEGVRRWFQQRGMSEAYTAHLDSLQQERRFNELLLATRSRLAQLYAQGGTPDTLRQQKAEVLQGMQQQYHTLQQQGLLDERYDGWMSRPVNNASLALIAAYYELEPELGRLLQESDGEMGVFYARAAQWARLRGKSVDTSGD